MAELVHILQFKLRSSLKLSGEWRTANVVKQTASLLVFGGFALGAYSGAFSATSYLLTTAKLGLFLLHRFLSMLLFVFFMSINVGNIIVSYATFYRSQEMSYYLTKPISHTQLFIMKFLDNFFYSSVTFFLLAAAVLLGYGSYFHMPPLFYVRAMVLELIPFMLLAGCTAVIMLLVLMRFADVIGVRRIVSTLVAIYLGTLYAYFSITNPLKLVASVMVYYPKIDQYFGYLDPPFAKFLPNTWIADSLYWTVRGDESYALSYTVILILATLLVFSFMVLLARKIFYKSWIASLHLRMIGESSSPLLRPFSLMRPARIDTQTSVLIKKDFWQFLREPSQWIHLGIVSMLIVTFIISVAQINLRQSLPFLQTVSYMVILLFNAFLIASIALRFVYPSIGTEGANLWTILSAPVNRKKYYGLKFLTPFIPLVILSEALVLVSNRSLTRYPAIIVASSVIMAGASFALVGLNVGAGAFFADFKEKNPIRAASSQSATLTFLVSITFLTLVVALTFIPFSGYFAEILRDVPFDVKDLFVGAGAVLALSVLVGLIPLGVGLRALRRDF